MTLLSILFVRFDTASAVRRPPLSIKINVSYREMHASAVDSNLTQWMFILNGNFSNKIDQFLMLFILRVGVKYSCVICRGNITWMKRTLLLLLIIPINSHAKGAHKLSKTVTSIMGIDAEDMDKDRLALNFETDVYYYQATDYAAPMLTYSTHGWDLGIVAKRVDEWRRWFTELPERHLFEHSKDLQIWPVP